MTIEEFLTEKLDYPNMLMKGCKCGQCWEPRCIWLSDIIQLFLNNDLNNRILVRRSDDFTLNVEFCNVETISETVGQLVTKSFEWDSNQTFDQQSKKTQAEIAKLFGHQQERKQ